MVHLCIDARLMNAAGIGSLLKSVLRGVFKDQSFQLTLLINKEDVQDPLLKQTHAVLIPLKSAIYSLKEHFELHRKIPYCDLFWSPHFNVPLLPIRAKKRVVTIHDCYHLTFSKQLSFVKRFYAQVLYNGAVFSAHSLLTDSHFSKKEIENRCFVKKTCAVIYCGLDDQVFKSEDQACLNRVIEKYRLPSQYILAVGNVKQHKNLTALVEAFTSIKKRGFSELKLVIVGKKEGFSSEDHQIFKNVAESRFRQDICFTGFVPQEDLPALYSLARLFVFPSLYEGFGLPPLEAMACGCPVIASSRASILEICRDAAFYVDPLSLQEMEQAIEHLLSNCKARQALIAKGKALVKLYPEKQTSNAYIELFKKLTV